MKNDIIKSEVEKNGGNPDVHYIGRIDTNIYHVISKDITTDHVVITEKQLEHIRERHPEVLFNGHNYLVDIVQHPDYILETTDANTAVILKRLELNGKGYQLILRLKTSTDTADYLNSILTLMKVNDKRWEQYLKNRKILYTRE